MCFVSLHINYTTAVTHTSNQLLRHTHDINSTNILTCITCCTVLQCVMHLLQCLMHLAFLDINHAHHYLDTRITSTTVTHASTQYRDTHITSTAQISRHASSISPFCNVWCVFCNVNTSLDISHAHHYRDTHTYTHIYTHYINYRDTYMTSITVTHASCQYVSRHQPRTPLPWRTHTYTHIYTLHQLPWHTHDINYCNTHIMSMRP